MVTNNSFLQIALALFIALIASPGLAQEKKTNRMQQQDGAIDTISTFEECVAAGHPTTKSFPPQCHAPHGRIFEKKVAGLDTMPSIQKSCKDLCGDGICQEIVCMALGCPCPETPQNCPADCDRK